MFQGIRFSLRLRIFLTLAAFYLVTLIVFTFFTVRYQRDLLMSQMVQRGKAGVDLLELSVAGSLYRLDIPKLTTVVRVAKDLPDVEHAYILDNEGKILGDSRYIDISDRTVADEFGRSTLSAKDTLVRVDNKREVMDIFKPVILGDEKLGGIRIGFDLKPTLQKIRQTSFRVIVVATAIFLSGLVVIFVIVGRITEPILSLTQGAKRIEEGDLQHRVSIKRGDEIGDLGTAFDHMADRLMRLFDEVSRRSKELEAKAVELERLNQELGEANRVKSEFMAAMSHELRTPLNVIIGNADLIKDGSFGSTSEKQRISLQTILRYSQVLLKLITDVLTLTRMDVRKMSLDLSTFRVDEIIAHAQSVAQEINRNGRLQILWQVERNLPPVTTDALKLEEILQNLIGNAFKFTPKGRIEVRGRSLPGHDRIEFAVADTGIGIAPSDIDKIFSEFYQLKDAHTGSYAGVGLGLSIVKKYLELMQGEIRVESQLGKGSTFTFTLPCSLAPSAKDTEEETTRVGENSLTPFSLRNAKEFPRR